VQSPAPFGGAAGAAARPRGRADGVTVEATGDHDVGRGLDDQRPPGDMDVPGDLDPRVASRPGRRREGRADEPQLIEPIDHEVDRTLDLTLGDGQAQRARGAGAEVGEDRQAQRDPGLGAIGERVDPNFAQSINS
jgi:hypothetical protein